MYFSCTSTPDAGDPDGLTAEQAFLEKIADRFRDAGVLADVVLLRGPRPAHEIAAYAEAHPGSVLALATHARPLGARLLLGSVAMAVVRHTSSPVLLRRYEHSR
jgi:nucleotide-binding universal stress UspA family protein